MLTIAGGVILGGIGLILIFIFLADLIKLGFTLVFLGLGFGLLAFYIYLMDFLLQENKAFGIIGGIALAYGGYYFYQVFKEKGSEGVLRDVNNSVSTAFVTANKLSAEELKMEAEIHGIKFVDGKYCFEVYKYDNLSDAVNYARLQAKKSNI